jgi:hypothetical protein
MFPAFRAAFLVVVTLLPSSMFGQGKATLLTQKVLIAGRVVDSAGKSVPQTNVILKTAGENETVAETSTDRDGAFIFHDLPAEAYELRFEASGFDHTILIVKKAAAGGEFNLGTVVLKGGGGIVDDVQVSVMEQVVQPVPSELPRAAARRSGDPIKTTICELVKNPEPFNGKLVQVRATVRTGFEHSLVEDKSCDSRIWFTGPGATYMTIGRPPAPTGAAVVLKDDREYRRMERYLSKQWHPRKYFPWQKVDICIDCSLYVVTATITGRFDYVKQDPGIPFLRRRGFGHLNGWDSQLVLESV